MRQGIDTAANLKALQQRKLDLGMPVSTAVDLPTSQPLFSRRAKTLMAGAATAAILLVGNAMFRAGGAKANYQADQLKNDPSSMPFVISHKAPHPHAPMSAPEPKH